MVNANPGGGQSFREFAAPTGWQQNGSTFWFSALVQQSNIGIFHFRFDSITTGNTGSVGFETGIGFQYNSGDVARLSARINSTFSSPPVFTTVNGTVPGATDTVLIVGSLTFSDTEDTVTVWLNPSLSSTDTSSLDSTSIVRSTSTLQAVLSSTPTVYLQSFNTAVTTIDEIRLGNSLSDVLVAVPEPSTYATLLAFVAFAIGFVRRRK